nr:MAG TPA: hypothetical protein [Bacteriophage sp.]
MLPDYAKSLPVPSRDESRGFHKYNFTHLCEK